MGQLPQEEPLVTTDWLVNVSEDLSDSELTPYPEAHIPQVQYLENW